MCGFENFNSSFGCSKCFKKFVTPSNSFGSKPFYSGFEISTWKPRDIGSHKERAKDYKYASSTAERKQMLKKCGVKYSELTSIPYLDIIRCHVVDPMHCIFFGLAKHIMNVWKDDKILQPSHFKILQQKSDIMIPPAKIGRISYKIESGFASFTADEWKNWIIIFSVHALHNIIEDSHFKCWYLLVESCVILLHPVISKSQV